MLLASMMPCLACWVNTATGGMYAISKPWYGATIVLAQPTITLPTLNFPNKRSASHLETGSDCKVRFIDSD
ncbi:hypothetical protein, partial [Leptolyngbya sp. AN03gr2]|uniref:hypothetical protein n=1 Tax=Leptolyngbya sp. AN03gr2 TaxID=3423364 RepID=UPI003D319255